MLDGTNRCTKTGRLLVKFNLDVFLSIWWNLMCRLWYFSAIFLRQLVDHFTVYRQVRVFVFLYLRIYASDIHCITPELFNLFWAKPVWDIDWASHTVWDCIADETWQVQITLEEEDKEGRCVYMCMWLFTSSLAASSRSGIYGVVRGFSRLSPDVYIYRGTERCTHEESCLSLDERWCRHRYRYFYPMTLSPLFCIPPRVSCYVSKSLALSMHWAPCQPSQTTLLSIWCDSRTTPWRCTWVGATSAPSFVSAPFSGCSSFRSRGGNPRPRTRARLPARPAPVCWLVERPDHDHHPIWYLSICLSYFIRRLKPPSLLILIPLLAGQAPLGCAVRNNSLVIPTMILVPGFLNDDCACTHLRCRVLQLVHIY